MKKIIVIIASLCLLTAASLAAFALVAFEAPSEEGSAAAFFCPADGCGTIIAKLIANASSSADCALYSLGDKELISTVESTKANVRLVLDKEEGIKGVKQRIKPRAKEGLMHNKFCVIDDTIVITGSFNPSGKNGYKDNIVVFHSKRIARNYADEFDELWSGKFAEGKKVRYPQVELNGIPVENYFCPEDNCGKRADELIKNAEQSVYFYAFSFTDEELAKLLIEKKQEGLAVSGIIDSSQNSKWSVYPLLDKKIDVRLNKDGVLHDKVFVIDNSTVLTGSWNPTAGGSERNDENIVIIRDKGIAMKYAEEFSRLLPD